MLTKEELDKIPLNTAFMSDDGELYFKDSNGITIKLIDDTTIDISGYLNQQIAKQQHYTYNADETIYLEGLWDSVDKNKLLLNKNLLETFFDYPASKQALEEEDFDSLYELFESYTRVKTPLIQNLNQLTALLVCADIDFIPHLSNLTTDMFYNVTLNDKQKDQYHERWNQLVRDPRATRSKIDESVWLTDRYGR